MAIEFCVVFKQQHSNRSGCSGYIPSKGFFYLLLFIIYAIGLNLPKKYAVFSYYCFVFGKGIIVQRNYLKD